MNITNQEVSNLKSCKTEEAWNKTCDDIKRVRGGQYPPDWFAVVMMSGMACRVTGNFT